MKRLFMYLYALLRSLYIFTIGYLFKNNRKLVSNMCELFGYQRFRELIDPDIRTIIPEVDISAIADDAASIKICETSWTDGNISLDELVAIVKLVKQCNPVKIFEIGTFDGRTTLNLASNTPEDAKIYTLDLPGGKSRHAVSSFKADASFVNKAVTGLRFHGTEYEKKITQLFGDSAEFDYSSYENSMDFVFVDGAHTYDYILSDTEKALKLLKDGRGVILWHDYSWVWQDVARALNRLYKTDSRFCGMRHIKGTSLVVRDSAHFSR